MWVEVCPFPDEYSAYFSEVGELLEKNGVEMYIDTYTSVYGLKHYVIKANVDEKLFEEIKRTCELTGFVATEISEPPHEDEITNEIEALLDTAMFYVKRGNKEEAIKRIARAIRIIKNCDGIRDKMKAFIEASKENPWLKGHLSFWEVDDIEELIRELKGGCWTVGTAFVWKDFCFAEQCNGCGEFAVFKYSNGKAFQFESISAQWMDEDKLREFLRRIDRATDEQLKLLEY